MPSPVIVIGAGVVGLCSAIRLLESGHPVQILAARPGSRSASGVAPALFTPYPGVEEARLMTRVRASLDVLREIERTHPAAGVRTRPCRWYKYSANSQADGPWEQLFDERTLPAPPGIASVLETRRPHMDTTRYLPWLEQRVKALGGAISIENVESLPLLLRRGAGIIVNCAGLGARSLAADDAVFPLRGIVARVPNIIGVSRSVHDDAPEGKVAYVFVYEDHLAIGSTFEAGEWDERIDPVAVEAMFERARNLLRLDGVERWRELSANGAEVKVGLRPARVGHNTYENTRVEAEKLYSGWVVHNYGHGRTGVTLSWACAAEVVDLVRTCG